MAVDLDVWADHGLEFQSAREALALFEARTGKKVLHRNKQTDPDLRKTDDLSEIAYYTDLETLDAYFESSGIVFIQTNLYGCNEIYLLKQTLLFFPTDFWVRYSNWQKLVTGLLNEDEADRMEELNFRREYWLLFRKYALELTRILSGTKVIYLNDHEYQVQEDICYEGGSVESFIQALTEIREPEKLEMLELFPDNAIVQSAWYVDEV